MMKILRLVKRAPLALKIVLPLLLLAPIPLLAGECRCTSCWALLDACERTCSMEGKGYEMMCTDNQWGCAAGYGDCRCTNDAPEFESSDDDDYSYE